MFRRMAPMSAHPHADPAWPSRILVAAFDADAQHDWPGRRCATIYLQGCPWRCSYCHNPQLQRRGAAPTLRWREVEAQLAALRGSIDGVVFSGGEPTADRALPDAIAAVRALGLPVGLHTGGAYPERLEALLPRLDWIGFDLKADLEHYEAITGVPGSGLRATRSARLLVASGVTHEFRLTWHPQLLGEDNARLVAHFAHHLGVRQFVLQIFDPAGVDNPALAASAAVPPRVVTECERLFGEGFSLRREPCGLANGATAS